MTYAAAVHGRTMPILNDLEAYEELLLTRKRSIEMASGIKFLPSPKGAFNKSNHVDEAFSPIAVDFAELFLFNCPQITTFTELRFIHPIWTAFTEKYITWRWPKDTEYYFAWLKTQNLTIGAEITDHILETALDLFLKEVTFSMTMAALSTEAGIFHYKGVKGFYSVEDQESKYSKIENSSWSANGLKLKWLIDPEFVITYVPLPRSYL
jgi:hypothetical protein